VYQNVLTASEKKTPMLMDYSKSDFSCTGGLNHETINNEPVSRFGPKGLKGFGRLHSRGSSCVTGAMVGLSGFCGVLAQ